MRTRKRAVQVYLNEKEYEKLEQLSRFSNINHSTVIRKLITGQEIRERPNMDFLSLVTEISHLGTNLNQIAYRANRMELTSEDLTEAKKILKDVQSKIRAAWRTWACWMVENRKHRTSSCPASGCRLSLWTASVPFVAIPSRSGRTLIWKR